MICTFVLTPSVIMTLLITFENEEKGEGPVVTHSETLLNLFLFKKEMKNVDMK